MATVCERIRWQVLPWHRQFIDKALPEINKDLQSTELNRIADNLKQCAYELFSLLPEVQFSEDGTEFICPAGGVWKPTIIREPRMITAIINELESYSDRYLYIYLDCKYQRHEAAEIES